MKARALASTLLVAILSWLPLTPSHAVERGVLPMAQDLSKIAQEAKSRGAAVLVLFSSAGCHYCGQVREEFLIPTTRNADYDDKVVMVEIEAGGTQRLVDFDGKVTTHGDFASRYRVSMTPTVKLLDARGAEATIPLVGIVNRDYYGGFLDQAIDTALLKIRGTTTTASRR